ncbi:MAG: virulence RhuM family protein [Deltaproteobacteria bacterium]|nr:MAG: virulence RhuM family protein [Deltaproteobacteria bacterium]TMQ25074.1 MAG: virulence RhuM family protein [Deltaproteobacteria bacterium]
MTDLVRQESEFFLYAADDGKVKVRVLFRDETAWLTQRGIAELFGVNIPAIAKHLRNIFESQELTESAVVSILETTALDGKAYKTSFYNLDAIIAVGYRVNSHQATQFRIWATATLREFMIKGFVLDDERLKQGKTVFGKDYFDDLLERIREIRASERRFYQKVADIYALSVDYDPRAPLTQEFFATVQNKLHWAITRQTAAEIIYSSADATKAFMGLTTWKHAPHGKILKSDVTVAKNYLSEAHVQELNRIVSAYLDLAENRAQRGIVMKMNDWATFLNGFLELSSYPILADKGKVNALEAKLKAEGEYEVYRKRQDAEYISDFDRVVEEARRLEGSLGRKALGPAREQPHRATAPTKRKRPR